MSTISTSQSTIGQMILMRRGGNYFVVYDTFTDINGTDLSSHTPDIGGPWSLIKEITTAAASAVDIQSNQARITVNSVGAVIDIGRPNTTIEVDWTPGVGVENRNSIIIRYSSDGNMWELNFREDNGDFRIQKIESDIGLNFGTVAFSWVEGQTYTIKAVVSENVITGYIDGVQKISYSSATFNNTETKFGILRNTGSDSSRLDNFKVY